MKLTLSNIKTIKQNTDNAFRLVFRFFVVIGTRRVKTDQN